MMEEKRNFGVILERDTDGVPTKGHALKPLESREMVHPRPEVTIGKIDLTPTILPDQPKEAG
jgi:hypothetical protein